MGYLSNIARASTVGFYRDGFLERHSRRSACWQLVATCLVVAVLHTVRFVGDNGDVMRIFRPAEVLDDVAAAFPADLTLAIESGEFTVRTLSGEDAPLPVVVPLPFVDKWLTELLDAEEEAERAAEERRAMFSADEEGSSSGAAGQSSAEDSGSSPWMQEEFSVIIDIDDPEYIIKTYGERMTNLASRDHADEDGDGAAGKSTPLLVLTKRHAYFTDLTDLYTSSSGEIVEIDEDGVTSVIYPVVASSYSTTAVLYASVFCDSFGGPPWADDHELLCSRDSVKRAVDEIKSSLVFQTLTAAGHPMVAVVTFTVLYKFVVHLASETCYLLLFCLPMTFVLTFFGAVPQERRPGGGGGGGGAGLPARPPGDAAGAGAVAGAAAARHVSLTIGNVLTVSVFSAAPLATLQAIVPPEFALGSVAFTFVHMVHTFRAVTRGVLAAPTDGHGGGGDHEERAQGAAAPGAERATPPTGTGLPRAGTEAGVGSAGGAAERAAGAGAARAAASSASATTSAAAAPSEAMTAALAHAYALGFAHAQMQALQARQFEAMQQQWWAWQAQLQAMASQTAPVAAGGGAVTAPRAAEATLSGQADTPVPQDGHSEAPGVGVGHLSKTASITPRSAAGAAGPEPTGSILRSMRQQRGEDGAGGAGGGAAGGISKIDTQGAAAAPGYLTAAALRGLAFGDDASVSSVRRRVAAASGNTTPTEGLVHRFGGSDSDDTPHRDREVRRAHHE